MYKTLFTTKPITNLMEESADTEHGLKRTLNAVNLTTLGIGAIIGAGIFVLTGQAAAQYAGPAIVISFIISGIACAFAGLCYAEFASMIPIAGSAYTYAYATLGQFIAWIIGWDLVLEYLFGASTVAVGWSGYIVSFLNDFGITFPPEYAASIGSKLVNVPADIAAAVNINPGWQLETQNLIKNIGDHADVAGFVHTVGIINIPAMFIIAVMTTLLVVGIKESANFNNLIVFIKVGVILLFLFLGWKFIHPGNWHPFVPANKGHFGEFGWSGVFRAAGVIFFAYIGFDAVSTTAQEAKNPQKDMPKGILGSLVICTVLYILVSLAMTGIVKYDQLNTAAPMAVAVDTAGPALFWLRPFIKVGAIAGLSSVILVMLMGQPRVFFSMSKDGLLPAKFSKVHPRFKTPYVTTIVTGVVALLVAGLFPISVLGELVSIGTLLAFVIVCAGVLVLRYKRPELKRPFRTPFFPVVPILGIITSLGVMSFLPGDTWLRLIVWMLIGFVIYFTYSRYHAKH